MLEKLLKKQEAENLQRYNDRYDTAKQGIDKMNELQSRHWEDIDVSKIDDVLHKGPEATTGPTPYEAEKAGEDAWE